MVGYSGQLGRAPSGALPISTTFGIGDSLQKGLNINVLQVSLVFRRLRRN
jgi:hypothetical protein